MRFLAVLQVGLLCSLCAAAAPLGAAASKLAGHGLRLRRLRAVRLGGGAAAAHSYPAAPTRATSLAYSALATKQWPAEPTAGPSADDLPGSAARLQQSEDEWRLVCTHNLEVVDRILAINENRLRAADARVGVVTTARIRLMGRIEEKSLTTAKLQERCFEEKKHCAHWQEHLDAQSRNLDESKVLADQVVGALGEGTARGLRGADSGAPCNASTLEDVRDSMRKQDAAVSGAVPAHSETCVGRMALLDAEVETIAAEEASMKAKLAVVMRDKEAAEALRDDARSDVEVVDNLRKLRAHRCERVRATLKAHAKALQELRSKSAKGSTATMLMLGSDCVVTDWRPTAEGGTCSKTCGGGVRRLQREVLRAATGRGAPCPKLEAELPCNQEPCAVDCVMATWSAWSACSSECSAGVRSRRRDIERPTIGAGAPCGLPSEVVVCGEGRSCGRGCEANSFILKM